MKKISVILFGIISLLAFTKNVNAEGIFTMDCDSNISPGDTTKCDVIYKGNTTFALVNLKGTYKLPNGFSYIKFVPNEVWNASNINSKGINLVSSIGLPINTNIGSLYLKLDSTLVTGSDDVSIGIESYKLKGETSSINEKIDITDSVYYSNNNNANLASLKIENATLSPNFDSNTYEYTARVTTEKVKVEFTTMYSRSTTDIKSGIEHNLIPGSNNIKITVKSPSNTEKTYTLNIVRIDNKDTNGLLSELSINNKKIDLTENNYNYKETVDYSITDPNFVYKTEKPTTKVEVIGNKELVVGENKFTIKTTSEANTVYEYNIIIVRQSKTLSSTNTLKSLKIKNHKIDFKSSELNYAVILNNEKSLEIEAIPTDKYSKVTISNNKDLKAGKIITIDVESETNIVKTYKIYIKEQEQKKVNILLYILIAVPIIIIITVSVILVQRKNKNKI